MMRPASTRYADGAVIIDATGADPDHAVRCRPLLNDFGLFLPATDTMAASLTATDGAKAVSIQLLGTGGVGLHAAMTPATARSFAEGLVALATAIEAAALDQASAALARAAGK